MSPGSLRIVSKVEHLTHISKSSLGAVGCWRASLLDQDNVVDLMGEHKSFYIFSFVFSFVSSYSISKPISFFFIRYILEGKELEFYMKKIQRKKGKGAAA